MPLRWSMSPIMMKDDISELLTPLFRKIIGYRWSQSVFELQKLLGRPSWEDLVDTRNSRKSVRWLAVPVPCLSGLWLKLRGEQGSGPEGVDDLCFHTYGGFSPPPPSSPPPSPSLPLKSQSRGPNSSLEAQIPVLRPKSQPQSIGH